MPIIGTSDSNFTYEDFEIVIKGELVSKFGNLVQRVVKFKERFYNSNETIIYNFNIDEKWLERFEELKTTFTEYMNAYEKFNFHEVIRFVNKIAELGNLWMAREEPWVHCKIDSVANEYILGNVAFTVWILAELLSPIMPSKAQTIKTHVYVKLDDGISSTYANIYQKIEESCGNVVINPAGYEPLFKQIDLTSYK
jgi:methionyl-tRNA synthetase